jgi:hypothetical protein
MASGESCQNKYDSPNSSLSQSRIRRFEGIQMEEVSKTISEMQQRIASKLRVAGANSQDKAVTAWPE